MNFATFFTQSIKDKLKKTKRGRYKGQSRSIKTKDLSLPGVTFNQNAQASKLSAPSASTFNVRG